MPTRFEFLLNYLHNLKPWLLDPLVTEIMIDPDGRGGHLVFVEKDGEMSQIEATVDEPSLLSLATDIARNQLHREIDVNHPSLSASLDDGSRIAIIIPPASYGGTTVTIRKFRPKRFTLDELIELGCMDVGTANILFDAICQKKNILISGENGSGKSTMLCALAAEFIPPDRRIICIEDDVREIHLDRHKNKTHIVASTEWPIAKAVEAALRHRIQTIIIGEVIGGEAMALLNALATGHGGSFATIHGSTPYEAVDRLASGAMESGTKLAYEAVRARIAQQIHFVLQMENRQVKGLWRLAQYSRQSDSFSFDLLREIPLTYA